MSIDPDPGSDSRAAPTPASGPTPPRSALPRSLAVALAVGLPAPAYDVVVSATTAGTHHLQGIGSPTRLLRYPARRPVTYPRLTGEPAAGKQRPRVGRLRSPDSVQ
jgi:hypothetical protein